MPPHVERSQIQRLDKFFDDAQDSSLLHWYAFRPFQTQKRDFGARYHYEFLTLIMQAREFDGLVQSNSE